MVGKVPEKAEIRNGKIKRKNNGRRKTPLFLITAGMFLTMSLYGYTTKRDLTKFGSFLMMGLFGIIIAMVVNIFVKSAPLDFVVSRRRK